LTLYVPDASVALKWCLPAREALIEKAIDLLDRYESGSVEFIIPDLFWAEIGNALWKAVRQGRCTAAAAEEALALMKGRALPTVPSVGLLEEAFVIARKYDRSFYDSLYVALAVAYRATFITADEKLANATAAHLPVKWLGALIDF
jgi:predicted nucleic acid-binding protein